MKSPFLRVLALPVCWLALRSARAEEVTISLGMPFDQVIEAIQKCNGQDTGDDPEPGGYHWLLRNCGVQVGLSEHYGKLNRLRYSSNGTTDQSAQSLKFDPEKGTFTAEALPSAPAAGAADGTRWIVRVEVLFVALASEKALSLLPDLRDPGKVDAAYAQLMAAIQRKEARLIGYPMIWSPSGQKSTAETIFEKIFPTGFDPSPAAPPPGSYGPPPVERTEAVPAVFDKRNAGVTLEVESVVDEGGEWIEINIQPQHVEFDGMDSYEVQHGTGAINKVEQPRFFTNKDSFSVTVRNGQRLLVGVHKSQRSDEVELHILQAVATPVPPQRTPSVVSATAQGGGDGKQSP